MTIRSITSDTFETTSTAHLDAETREDVLARLARIEGHVRAVRTMIEKDATCEDALMQLAAVRAATTKALVRLFEGHMDTCVDDCVKTGRGPQAIDGLKAAFSTLIKQV